MLNTQICYEPQAAVTNYFYYRSIETKVLMFTWPPKWANVRPCESFSLLYNLIPQATSQYADSTLDNQGPHYLFFFIYNISFFFLTGLFYQWISTRICRTALSKTIDLAISHKGRKSIPILYSKSCEKIISRLPNFFLNQYIVFFSRNQGRLEMKVGFLWILSWCQPVMVKIAKILFWCFYLSYQGHLRSDVFHEFDRRRLDMKNNEDV